MSEMRGVLRTAVPMARYTTWRVGGPADQVYEPADSRDLAVFLGSGRALAPLHWLGLGSNLLVRDGGLHGTVIRLHRGLSRLTDQGDGQIRVEAGVPCAKIARACGRLGYAGAAFLAGIPGTIGGALAMNAGAWGGETWSHVVAVETVGRDGHRRERPPTDYRVGYREVHGVPDEWFTAAVLRFEPGADPAALRDQVRALLGERAEKQPTGIASGGSVFRNPPGDHAARLIDTAGLRGAREGGAWIAEKHANFIVHEGDARAADIEALIERVQQQVRSIHGVDLVPEVRIIGEAVRHVR